MYNLRILNFQTYIYFFFKTFHVELVLVLHPTHTSGDHPKSTNMAVFKLKIPYATKAILMMNTHGTSAYHQSPLAAIDNLLLLPSLIASPTAHGQIHQYQ